MAGFNKFPTKQDSASSSSSGSGLYPIFEVDPSYNGPDSSAIDGINMINVGGYDNDGDYIQLPSTNTGSMAYYDNTGAQVTTGAWSGGILPTDIDAASDAWVGFMLDQTDLTMYVCTVDTTSTPDKFNLASITKAGVITNISAAGGTAVTTDFTTAPSWSAGAITTGSSSLYRDSDGTGNLTVRVYVAGTSIEDAIFNVSTGALVADTEEIINTNALSYKTPAGNYIGGLDRGASSDSILYLTGRTGIILWDSFTSIGLCESSQGTKFLQWGGRIVAANANATPYGPRAWAVGEFNTRVDEFCAAAGCEA